MVQLESHFLRGYDYQLNASTASIISAGAIAIGFEGDY